MSIPKYTVEFWLGDDSVVIEVDASNLSNVEWCKYSDVEELQEENARLKEKLEGMERERDNLLTLLKGTASNFMKVVDYSEGEA